MCLMYSSKSMFASSVGKVSWLSLSFELARLSQRALLCSRYPNFACKIVARVWILRNQEKTRIHIIACDLKCQIGVAHFQLEKGRKQSCSFTSQCLIDMSRPFVCTGSFVGLRRRVETCSLARVVQPSI